MSLHSVGPKRLLDESLCESVRYRTLKGSIKDCHYLSNVIAMQIRDNMML